MSTQDLVSVGYADAYGRLRAAIEIAIAGLRDGRPRTDIQRWLEGALERARADIEANRPESHRSVPRPGVTGCPIPKGHPLRDEWLDAWAHSQCGPSLQPGGPRGMVEIEHAYQAEAEEVQP